MYRGEFYRDHVRGYADGHVKHTIMEAVWEKDLKAGKLSVMVDDPLVLRRHPRETAEKPAFTLDPRTPEKPVMWSDDRRKRVTYCEQFWQGELDEVLIDSIEQHGVFWPRPFWAKAKGTIQEIIKSHPQREDALDPHNRWLGKEWEGRQKRWVCFKWVENQAYLW